MNFLNFFFKRKSHFYKTCRFSASTFKFSADWWIITFFILLSCNELIIYNQRNMTLFTRSCFLYHFLSPHIAGRSLNISHMLPSVSKIASPLKFYSSGHGSTPSDKMTETLRHKFPLAKKIEVVDVSGGCGSMYEIFVESVEFKGLPIVKQHRLINDVLKEDIKQMHGLRISTKVPSENG